ncbi:MAG: prepilin-type N-terminal cleavage/methylation domain-containing protein [Candidatus Omnitrophica bacterium]|nr:prepilin-type N-terminal cleavage/methylation domain-containing protein [Candidatus Omnitrophota bacterium]
MKPAFTLIELLVTTSIILLLAGFGLASWQTFNQQQTLDAAAQDLKNNLRLARSWAMAVKKVACAGTSGGYKVDFSGNTGDIGDNVDYGIREMCGDSEVGDWQNFSYPEGVADDYNGSFIFAPLTGDKDPPGDIEITLSLSGREKKVSIKTNGKIE